MDVPDTYGFSFINTNCSAAETTEHKAFHSESGGTVPLIGGEQ